jgi:pullulanase-type alpha-1,6-glucosidase
MAWPGETAYADWEVWCAPHGGIGPGGENARRIRLRPNGPIPDADAATHPHLATYHTLLVPELGLDDVLRGEILVAGRTADGTLACSGVQVAPMLDRVLAPVARTKTYGYDPRTETFRVWAPTARSVTLVTWRNEELRTPMIRAADGSWSVSVPGAADVEYAYEVVVYVATTGRVETNLVTDPASVALTADSQRSVAIDLADPRWSPRGWGVLRPPRLERSVDESVYELHVRDFSAFDDLVPAMFRGTYLAFAEEGRGRRHLRTLAEAGLTTVHLLPVFDVGSIGEDRRAWVTPAGLDDLPPDSVEQQRHVGAIRHRDPFNWGYDPWHWSAPEGSYALRSHGGDRIREFRTMVQAIHDLGLRVVMDVVYNHTHASGQEAQSVLDRIVPGYYHRRDALGGTCHSAAANNVATEHAMTEHLIVSSLLTWATHHHIDGFRIDLMGHHPLSGMRAARKALDALTDSRGGDRITLYGEGWNFGEVADGARFVQATQGNLAGTGIATFNDRLRDAVRGGKPFDPDPRWPGFATGSAETHRGDRPHGDLGHDTDLLMLGLAGNLRQFEFTRTDGGRVSGETLRYHGRSAGYASEPDEVISYVDAHDNETLFDAITLKISPSAPMSVRIRLNTLALACATLAQTGVLWHGGTDVLRSKSLDRNSYDSGDHFNRLDWSGRDNGFGRGLPPAWDNQHAWPAMAPLLADATLKPGPDDVALAAAMAHDLLRLRRSTRLLRLGSAALIRQKVSFPVSGTDHALAGVVAMVIDDLIGDRVDPSRSGVAVVFNASPRTVRQTVPGLSGGWVLSPVQRSGADDVVRHAAFTLEGPAFIVPARTVAVFVR